MQRFGPAALFQSGVAGEFYCCLEPSQIDTELGTIQIEVFG
jgi:hypothetical protein